MLNADRVWSRVSQRPEYRGKNISQYTTQVIVQNFTLTSAQVSAQTAVIFPAGGIILGIIGEGQPSSQTATQTYRPGLDLFAVSIDYQATARNIVGTSRAIGTTVFGVMGDQFPGKEIIIPVNGALLYTVENLTTTTITVSFSHHSLTPAAIG
jgi:hypothetical protein